MLAAVCQHNGSNDHQPVTLACIALRLRHEEWSGFHAALTGLSLAQALQALCLNVLNIKLTVNCNTAYVKALQETIKRAVAGLHGAEGTPSDLGILRAGVPQLLRTQTDPDAAVSPVGAQV